VISLHRPDRQVDQEVHALLLRKGASATIQVFNGLPIAIDVFGIDKREDEAGAWKEVHGFGENRRIIRIACEYQGAIGSESPAAEARLERGCKLFVELNKGEFVEEGAFLYRDQWATVVLVVVENCTT
jgi:hypothetical protein